MPVLWLPLLVVGAIVSTPASGAAASPPEPTRVALSALEVDGALQPHWRDLLAGRLREGVGRSEWEVMTTPTRCESDDCRRQLAERMGVDYLVEATVGVSDQIYRVRLQLIDGRTGTVELTGEETCELCGVAEVGDVVASQAAALVAKIDRSRKSPASIRVRTRPSGATVVVDGEMVGKTPLQLQPRPGPHVVRVEHAGYAPREVSLESTPGFSERLDLDLIPDRRTRRVRWLVPWGVTAVVVGAAALATGSTLLALHGREYKGRCTGSDVDAMGNCRYRYDTRAGGIASTVTGGVLLGTGIGLLIGARRHQGRTRPDVAVAWPRLEGEWVH